MLFSAALLKLFIHHLQVRAPLTSPLQSLGLWPFTVGGTGQKLQCSAELVVRAVVLPFSSQKAFSPTTALAAGFAQCSSRQRKYFIFCWEFFPSVMNNCWILSPSFHFYWDDHDTPFVPLKLCITWAGFGCQLNRNSEDLFHLVLCTPFVNAAFTARVLLGFLSCVYEEVCW